MQNVQSSEIYSYPEASPRGAGAVSRLSLRHFYHWETAAHWWLALATGGGYGWHIHFDGVALPGSSKDLITAVVTVVGIVLAFLATFQGFLFSMQESLIIQRLKQASAYDKLLKYFSRSINYCLVMLIFSLGLYFAEFNSTSDLTLKMVFTAWLFLGVLTLGSSCRIIWLFQGLLRRQ